MNRDWMKRVFESLTAKFLVPEKDHAVTPILQEIRRKSLGGETRIEISRSEYMVLSDYMDSMRAYRPSGEIHIDGVLVAEGE